mmetsp:Transcript_23098/g.75454  ORF Transcript_23098/g.75454 Transcript_23098/m.75454 type:complete len:81 (+) Transcript_23098:68-310(+)
MANALASKDSMSGMQAEYEAELRWSWLSAATWLAVVSSVQRAAGTCLMASPLESSIDATCLMPPAPPGQRASRLLMDTVA